ncbi:MAG: branched-chain amino acid transaminase [Ignavibacteria bacterium]|nr:branched-chain amino acid transaminase [Ignavibacteria bacterium]MCC7158796.1 branched-chain amino acid transaminase [Ignavibacteria bacterium]
MAVKSVEKIWMNGKLIDWAEAKVHVLSHVIHYGSSFFEGIRCYKSKNGAAVFRLGDHVKRLILSAKVFRAEIPYSYDQIFDAILETIRANDLENCYIRPIAYRGYDDLNVNPLKNPVELTIAAYEWGSYLGQGAHESGIDVCVSSWRRSTPDTTPTMAKIGGAYMNSQLIKMEAIVNGFSEGIALDVNGYVGEGSGENLFLVQDNIIYTPGIHNGILSGITRKSVITLAKDLGYEVKEGNLMREMLYMSDEMFFSGTAAEITPIRSVDKMNVGNGMPGKVTKELQHAFFDVVKEGNDRHGWLTYVDGKDRILPLKNINAV